ncbi:type II toxin-antitoxin system death-on-curing family toxin [Enterococcus sp. LJL51]|uniref:type II toxin-antitoxin system death-on-curing family toxin n=1 Tax=Enterococcus sp. LJL51 TaxID=3416656 RepID=UPI003CF87BD0
MKLTAALFTEINDFCQKKAEHLVSPMYGIRDEHGLESIAASVDQYVFDREVYPNLFSKAAFVWMSLTNYHCFYNGNKRTALFTVYLYLYVNGCHMDLPESQIYDAALSIASGRMSAEEIAKLLKQLSIVDNNSSEVAVNLNLFETIYLENEDLVRILGKLAVT